MSGRDVIVTTGEVIDADRDRPVPTVTCADPVRCRCRGFVVDRAHPAWAYHPTGTDGEPTGHHPDCALYRPPTRPVEVTSEDLFDTLGELAIQADKRRASRPQEAGLSQVAHDTQTAVKLLWDLFTG